jgi:hypothetical protein
MEESTQSQFNIRLASGQEYGPATLAMIEQWAREGRVPVDGLLVPKDGGQVRSVLSEPNLLAILQAPPTTSAGLQLAPQADAPMSGVIPYKNPPALIGYYLAVFSLILGPLLGIPAVVLGIVGLVKRSKEPRVRGLAHAWVAILLGSVSSIGCTWIIMAMAMNRR